MIVLGVDPGATGGLALVHSQTRQLIGGRRMPSMKVRGKSIVDAGEVHHWLDAVKPSFAIVEQVHAMPRQGVSSSFSFGRSTGAIEALAMIHTDRMDWVTPAVWKKYCGLGKQKRDSLDRAKLAFGDEFVWRALADDGIAEAALMALWWLEVKSGKAPT